ncbi:MAG: DNRLRE domain-containing protein [Chloroflexota bacterium]
MKMNKRVMKSRTIIFLFCCGCFLFTFINYTKPTAANNHRRILNNILNTNKVELYELARNTYNNEDYLEASFYLTALLSRYPSLQTIETKNALTDSIENIEAWKDGLETAKRWCHSGCNEEGAEKAFPIVTSTYTSLPLPELPSLSHQNAGRMLCRGGGELLFINKLQPPETVLWVKFADPALKIGKDYQKAYLLEPGECSLLNRKIKNNEKKRVSLQPFLGNYTVAWDASGNIQQLGANNSASSSGIAPTVSVWEGLEDLTSELRYVELAVGVDDNGRFIARNIRRHGPWSDYERAEIWYQDGRFPTSGYDGTSDTTIRQHEPNLTLGNQNTCYVDRDDPPGEKDDMATLLRWEIDAIPANSLIKSVTITLNILDESEAQYRIYGLKQPWVELQTSWRFYDTNLAWQQSGAKGMNDQYETPIAKFRAQNQGLKNIQLNEDGIAMVQAWLDEPTSNNGVIIRKPQATDGLDFNCSEVTEPEKRPLLYISYVEP